MTVFLHGIEVWRTLRPRERYALKTATHVIANSDRTIERFRAANPALNTIAVHACPLGAAAAPARHIQAAAEGFALIVGRLASDERYKGHDALIEAWPAILKRVPGARLLVVGEGDDRARLEARAAAGGLGDAVQFLGPVSPERLLGLYRACAALVMPSSGEGFGLAYLEAMREGKPCLALRSASEIVEDGVTGLLVDEPRPELVAAAVARLLGDESLRRRLGDAGAQRFAAFFTEAHFGRRFRQAIGLTPASREGFSRASADIPA